MRLACTEDSKTKRSRLTRPPPPVLGRNPSRALNFSHDFEERGLGDTMTGRGAALWGRVKQERA